MEPKVSIIVPTKNGEKYLEKCLNMVFKQKAAFVFEVLIIDSGSTDGTLEIINKFVFSQSSKIKKFREKVIVDKNPPQPSFVKGGSSSLLQREVRRDFIGPIDFKFFQIPPLEFGHGKTRNLAVSKASGEYLVFITQDAIPFNENWLGNLIKPLENDENIAGVFGRHLPHEGCDPFQRKSLDEFMETLRKNLVCQLISNNREQEFEKNKNELSFFSNVNSAIRKSVWEKIHFQEVDMGEDQFWAKDILLAGYKKAYAPEAKVYHSHNYGIWNQFKRWFDEFRQHKINIKHVGVSSIFKIPLLTLRLWANDVKYIKRQKEYALAQKIYWIIWIFFMDFARFCAEYLGGHYERLPKWLENKLSMQWEIIHRK